MEEKKYYSYDPAIPVKKIIRNIFFFIIIIIGIFNAASRGPLKYFGGGVLAKANKNEAPIHLKLKFFAEGTN